MPQFDQVTFFNQAFWFFICFFTFYFVTVYFFLPFLCTNLKIRKKKFNFNKIVYNNNNFDIFIHFLFFNAFFNEIDKKISSLLSLLIFNFSKAEKPFKHNFLNILKFKKILNTFWFQLIIYIYGFKL